MTVECGVGQGIITCYLSLADVALLGLALVVVFWIGIIIGGVVTKRRGTA